MRVGFVGWLGAVGLVIAACGSSSSEGKTPSGARASCSTDHDCVVTDHAACCRACPEQPFAIPALNHAQIENKCAAVECAAKSDRIECPKVDPKDAFLAICNEGTCAVRKK
jgi:hypothetical protein